jgi:hypothetical protein
MQYTFHIGQLVHIVRPSSGYGDRRIYCVVSLLAEESDGNPVYRIKNTIGGERLVKQDEIAPASADALP